MVHHKGNHIAEQERTDAEQGAGRRHNLGQLPAEFPPGPSLGQPYQCDKYAAREMRGTVEKNKVTTG